MNQVTFARLARLIVLALLLLVKHGNQTSPEPPIEAAPKVSAVRLTPDLLARRELGLQARPVAVISHDFDGDGFDDIAVATEKPGQVMILTASQEGLRLLEPAVSIGDFPTELTLMDDQLVVGSKSTGELLGIRVARGKRGLAPMVTWRMKPGGTPSALAVANFSNEASILWATRDDRLLHIENGVVREVLRLETGARIVGILASLQQSSLALFCQGSNDVRIFEMNTDGSTTLRRQFPMNGVPRSGIEADLDGDGDLETAFVGGDNEILIFGLDEAHGFASGVPIRATQPGIVPITLGHRDLNLDGREELVSLGLSNQAYSVLGNFNSTGPQLRLSEYAGQDPIDFALGDFDGDGKGDLAVACRSAHSISLLSGSGQARAGKPSFDQAARLGVGGNPLSIATADLTGPNATGAPDGKPEIATLDAADGMLSLLSNDGFGRFSLSQRAPVGASPRGLVVLTLKNSKQVLVALSVPAGSTGRLVAFGSQKRGIKRLQVTIDGDRALPKASEAQVTSGDVDGDGSDDLVLADSKTRTLHVYLSRGVDVDQLRLKAAPAIELPQHPRAVALLQRPEGTRFAVAFDREIAIYSAKGQWIETLPMPSRAQNGRGCARLMAADLNGDGFDDLASLWLGPQGTSPGLVSATILGSESRLTFDLPCGQAPADLAAADLNGDGLAEILVAAQNSHVINLWVNLAQAGFRASSSLGVGLGPLDIAVADLLGNGTPSLVVANAFSADVSVIYNRPLTDQ